MVMLLLDISLILRESSNSIVMWVIKRIMYRIGIAHHE
jgi:hypothetical protein